jgi:hypothetical protein
MSNPTAKSARLCVQVAVTEPDQLPRTPLRSEEPKMVELVNRYLNHGLPEVRTLLGDADLASDLQEQALADRLDELAQDREPERVSSRSSPTTITNTLRQHVLALYQAGRTSRQIADELCVAKSTVLGIVNAGGVVRPTNRILTDEQVAEAKLLRSQGWLYREIGEKYGVHKDTIRRRVLGF